MSIDVFKHFHPTNETRLHLAMDVLTSPTDLQLQIRGRERLDAAIAWLSEATPGRSRSEQYTCGLCREGARRLKAIQGAPRQAPWQGQETA